MSRVGERLLLCLGLAITVPALAAWGQRASSIEEQFAAYHQRLSGAAESLLAAPTPLPQRTVTQNVLTVPGPEDANESFSYALKRVQQLRPLLEPILRETGVPTDVAAVVLVESGGRLTALSPKGALGLWQLMPETARRYGLTVGQGKDERTDVTKATRAAARYLRDLYAQFGDWQLAFAAYNVGEQAVQRAMLRAGSSDFQRVRSYLPSETRAYVPAVLATRPLFDNLHNPTQPSVQRARAAQVLYASAKLEN
jgi:soluble lytic murein transglycosylase-like protein